MLEETGIDCRCGTDLSGSLRDWELENDYEIYPRWQHRYAPGVTRNTEHLFGQKALRILLRPASGNRIRSRTASELEMVILSLER